MSRQDLFPPIEPFASGMLPLDPPHAIYWEQCGNPEGPAVVFLHGGPGAGATPTHRRFFDPAHYRVVLLCQRGSGRSTPSGELRENTTWDLVQDLETLREKLGIRKWIVFGGSWGSTLALAYAVTHPDRVLGLIVRGIFLCRKKEIDWLYQEGASNLFPDPWEDYVAAIPPAERGDFVGAYYRRLTSNDEGERLRAALAWSLWEAKTSYLIPDEQNVREHAEPQRALALARIECHYFQHRAFFATDNFLLEQIGRVRHLPGVIVQGRYDVVCPPVSAWDLHRAWPEAEFQITPDAGHSALETGNRRRLVQAADAFRRIRMDA